MKSSQSTLSILPGVRKQRRKAKGRKGGLQVWLETAWQWLRNLRGSVAQRRLRVGDSVSLGEKRFAAILEFESRQFLIGGSANSVVLLAELSGDLPSKNLPELRRTPECQ